MTTPARHYRGDRPSRIVLRLEQRAREQRKREIGKPSLFTRLATFIRQSFAI